MEKKVPFKHDEQSSRILRVLLFIYRRISPLFIYRAYFYGAPTGCIYRFRDFNANIPRATVGAHAATCVVCRCQRKSGANKVGNSAAYLSRHYYVLYVSLTPFI